MRPISFVAFRPKPTGADTNVSTSDLRAYYDAHKAEFDRPGRAVAQRVVHPARRDCGRIAAARDKAAKLRAEIVGGAKFEDVAKRESARHGLWHAGRRPRQGDQGALRPGIREGRRAALKPGELSQPVLTQFGYHIIRLDSRSGDTLGLHHILVRIAAKRFVRGEGGPQGGRAREARRPARDQPAKFDEAAKSLGLTPFTVQVIRGRARDATARATSRA